MRIKVRLEIVGQMISLIGLPNQDKYVIDEKRILTNTGTKAKEEWIVGSFSKLNPFIIDSIPIQIKEIDYNKAVIISYNDKRKVVKSESIYLLATTISSAKRGAFHNEKQAKNVLEKLIFKYDERTKFRTYPMTDSSKMFILENDGNRHSKLVSDTSIKTTEINSYTVIAAVGFEPTVVVHLSYSEEFDVALIELYSDIPLRKICTDLKYFIIIDEIKEFLETYLEK